MAVSRGALVAAPARGRGAGPPRPRAAPPRAAPPRSVDVAVFETPRENGRLVFAGVDCAAPPAALWRLLTAYSALADVVPGLAGNRVLAARPNGALVEQVGSQEVLLGWTFTARAVLEVVERAAGTPDLLLAPGDGAPPRGRFPRPRPPGAAAAAAAAALDITFDLSAAHRSDFSRFSGLWRMEPAAGGGAGSRLSYSLFVAPPPWVPVALIQARVAREVGANLAAVARAAERVHAAAAAAQAAQAALAAAALAAAAAAAQG
jgi:hypothetical protein